MKPICIVVLALALMAPVASRAQTSDDALGALKQQMQEMQQKMQKMQQKIEELEAAKSNAPPTIATGSVTPTPSVTTQQPWSPAQPITVARAGGAYMNVSFDTLVDVGWSTEPNVDKV